MQHPRRASGKGGVLHDGEPPTLSPKPAQRHRSPAERRRSTVRAIIREAKAIVSKQRLIEGWDEPDARKELIMFMRERGMISDVQAELLIAHNGLKAA